MQSDTRGATTDAVTYALREGILEGILPAGTWLREEDLASALDVSRTPVRESLLRLSDEHLVTKTANRGSVVEPMTIEDVYAMYLVREALEGLAVSIVTANTPEGLLDVLVGIHAQLVKSIADENSEELKRLNLKFHRTIRAATDNVYLIRILDQIENGVRRSGVTAYSNAARLQYNEIEHAAIIAAIAAGDAEQAGKVARNHMQQAREARLEAVRRRMGII